VQLLLSATSGTQDALVTWSQDPAAPISSRPEPVEPGAVTLQLELPSGDLIPLDALPGSPGVFRAPAAVQVGSPYRLRGEVAGAEVQGATIVPALPSIVSPPGDTITVGSCFPCTLAVEWEARGADVLEVQVRRASDSASTLLGLSVLRASPALVAIPPDAVPGELLFIAHDRGSANFLFKDPPIGNLGAVPGFLGSQAIVRKILR